LTADSTGQPAVAQRPTGDRTTDATAHAAGAPARAGVAYGIAAYAWWGLVPVYFKAVAHVPALEVLAHRVIWSVVLLAALIVLKSRWREAASAMRRRRTAVTLLVTTVLIACNWLIFIYAVATDRLLEASLGYFINPLVNVLLGFVFLGERLRRWQTISVALAAVGVLYLTLGYGRFPWIALALAASFGLYGLLRKTAPVDALIGLTVETTLLLPLALAYVLIAGATGAGKFAAGSWSDSILLVSAGIVTAVPLLWFTNAARRLRLATLGFLQYLAPTGHFLLAVAAYGETFTTAHLLAFGCIWTALAIYSIDTVRAPRAAAPVAKDY